MKNRIIGYFFSFLALFVKRRPTARFKQILVVSTTGLGDTLWATPALNELHEQYPHLQIDLLTSRIGKELFDECPFIRYCFSLNGQGFWSQLVLFFKIKRIPYDGIFFFHTSQRMLLPLLFLSSCPIRVGFHSKNKGLDFLLSHALPPKKTHQIFQRFQLLQPFFYLRLRSTLFFYPTLKPVSAATRMMKAQKPFIVIHPGAKDRYKCWDPHLFRQLAKRLIETFSCQVIVTGSKEEVDLAAIIKEGQPAVWDMTGKLRLKELGFLLKSCELMITADTGPMHLASALNTPLIALFAPTDSEECGPLNPKAHMIQRRTTCSPCIKKQCYDPFCMKQIALEEVFRYAKAILETS